MTSLLNYWIVTKSRAGIPLMEIEENELQKNIDLDPSELIKIAIIFTSTILILWIIKPLYLKPFGKFLVYNSPQTYKKGTKIADAAIVLTGGNGNRINEAISLYLNKNVDHILISGDEGKSNFLPPLELELKKHAINSGVNEDEHVHTT